jgi:hypothetical protein
VAPPANLVTTVMMPMNDHRSPVVVNDYRSSVAMDSSPATVVDDNLRFFDRNLNRL